VVNTRSWKLRSLTLGSESAAEQRDELAPLHCQRFRVSNQRDSASQYGTRVLHCGFQTPAMSAWGQGLPFTGTSGDLQSSSAVPKIPDATTAAARDGRSVPGSDICTAQKQSLFNHFVGAREHGRRDAETEHLGDLKIDHKIETGRLLDGQVAWVGAA
jgi:hypothetical protein